MVDSVFRTRSLGVAAEGLPDQYADGTAARVWEFYIGCTEGRTSQYRQWLSSLLREKGCQNVLDVACGTGVDSILLLEEGFNVISTDASDKMLKYAWKKRWTRRKEKAFDNWVIEEANWLTLVDDMDDIEEKPEQGFDAVICSGNSFAHLPDFEGTKVNQKVALANFWEMVKPGGVLLLDHRNYDEILATGTAPCKSVYYNSDHIVDIRCSNLYVNGVPSMVTMDYVMDMSTLEQSQIKKARTESDAVTQNFRLSYYPHCLAEISQLLRDVFGPHCEHTVYGDFLPLGKVRKPAYYIHVIKKPD